MPDKLKEAQVRKSSALAAAIESLELHRLVSMVTVTPDAVEIVPSDDAGSSHRLFGSASRVSPCRHFTIETLEGRKLFSFSSRLEGNFATFEDSSGDTNADIVSFNTSGGMLAHNRASDPGFNSAFDFDSTVAGDQMLAADAASFVNIRPGDGADTIEFGTPFSTFNQPASKLLAAFSVEHYRDPSAGVTVVVDDSASGVANAFEIAPDHITATGITVEYVGRAPYTQITVTGGSAADTFNVTSSPNVPYLINGNQPASAPGDVLNFDAQFNGATDNGSEITQTGRKPVQYQNIETVNVFNQTAGPSDFVVKNTNNTGNNSLRYAILAANAFPGSNTITFDIPGSGVHVIAPRTDLPEITDTVVINGYSQPGAKPNTLAVGDNAVIKIELDGGGNHPDPGFTADFGLTISAPSSEVRGLSVVDFTSSGPSGGINIGYAIRVNTSNAIIAGNFVGLHADGTAADGSDSGIEVFGRDNRIGGTAPADRNVCSGNGPGIELTPSGTGGPNLVLGNYIGTDASGTQARPNSTGIVDHGGSQIGGSAPGAGNLISGNLQDGIDVYYATDATIRGNVIGLASDGITPLANANGIYTVGLTKDVTIGGKLPGERNIVSGNTRYGVVIDGVDGSPTTGVVIQGNYIGVDAAGTTDAGNGFGGIYLEYAVQTLIGGAAPGERNIISGNSVGVEIGDGAKGTRILGNYIGPDITGNAFVFGGQAIAQFGEATGTEIGGAGEGNVIIATSTGAPKSAIFIQAGDCRIRGNRIGTNAGGTVVLGSGGRYGIRAVGGTTTIGGADAGERNIISGFGTGISSVSSDASTTGLTVRGNYIGTDVTGTIALGNYLGIEIKADFANIGGAAPGEGNLISGNQSYGISVNNAPTLVQIYGNRIGTDVTGKQPMGNGNDGIYVTGGSNSIGGTSSGLGNIIAFNGGNGVRVGGSEFPASAIFILSNSIFSNALLGIDLGSDGVTPNDVGDADTGPNELINTPVLSAAFTNATGVAVTGAIGTKLSTYTGFDVQFFVSPGADPSGFGEGKLLLGTIHLDSDGSGNDINFAAEFPVSIPAGQVITATTTNSQEGTSEFSKAVTVTGNPPRLSINDVTVTEGNGVPVSATFTIKLSDAVSGPVKVDFATADGTAVAQADYLSHTGSVTFNPGETTRTVTVTVNPDVVAEGTETFVVNLSNAQIAGIADAQGVGTILDFTPPTPPPPPSFSINDVTLAEGNGPGATAFTFTITRGGDTTVPASVQYATADGTATAPGDYAAVALTTVNFIANQSTAQVTVNVVGDTTVEGNDTFFVNLSNPSAGASITDAQGLGTINNDDVAPPAPPASAVIGPDPAAPGKMALIITGTDNGEYIDVDPGSSSSKLKVEVNDVVIGEFLTSAFDRIYVYAKGGEDRVSITTSTTKTAIVFGGEGADQIKGGNGKDILLGEAGADIIRGRKGRDIIIGGLGADGISGDEDDDLIVAAATTFDADLPGLFAFQKEWISSNSYSKRRDNIRNGSGSNVGGRKLNDASFLEDNALDLLSGNSGTDLFFYHKTGSTTQVADKINDKSSSETAVDAS